MNISANKKDSDHADTNKQLAVNILSSINDASSAGRALYTGYIALTAYIIVAIGTTNDLQFFDRAPLTLPLLNVEISLTGFYRFTPWLYLIVHANLLLVFSIIAEKHRYFAELVYTCAWPDRIQMRQQLHVNAFTQFLGADHKGLLALILMLMTWFTIGIMPPLLLLAIQLDFLSAQVESVTNWQQLAVFVDCLLAGYFWNNILQKKHRARFPKDLNRPFWKRYLLEGWVLWVSVLFIIGFSWLVALVPLSEYERSVHNYMPERIGLAGKDCVTYEDLVRLKSKINSKQESAFDSKQLKELEYQYNNQLVKAAKNVRNWDTPYQCSNALTWWFIDRSDSWLNKRLQIHRWLNLPDKVFVENRKTAQPQWLNRLKSELRGKFDNTKPTNNPTQEENINNTTNTDGADSFKTLDYFLPVNKENQHLHFARFTRSFLPKAKMIKTELQGASFKEAKLQGTDFLLAKLQGADFSMAKLQGTNFKKAELQGTDFSMADLRNADFSEADLHKANFKEATLQGADLSKADLKQADLFGADLQNIVLKETKLQGADLQLVNLVNVNLAGYDLQGVNFSTAKLQGAILSRAKLPDAILSEAKLQHANLNLAQLQYVDLSIAELNRASLRQANLLCANLSNVELQAADLSEAKLQGADLSKAELQGADLTKAELQGADLSMVELLSANLQRAMLQGTVFSQPRLTGVQFSHVKLDYALILDPLVEWKKSDDQLISKLKSDTLNEVNKFSKERLLNAIKRMENAKSKPLPNISKATLENKDHRCLLLSDSKALKKQCQTCL